MTHNNQIKPVDEIRETIKSFLQYLDGNIPLGKIKDDSDKESADTSSDLIENALHNCLKDDEETAAKAFEGLFSDGSTFPDEFNTLEINLKTLQSRTRDDNVLMSYNKIFLLLKLIKEIKLSLALDPIPTNLGEFDLYEEDHSDRDDLTFYNSADDSEENYYVYDGDDKKNSFVFMRISSSGRLEINDTERTAPRTPILLYTILLICRRSEPIRQGKWLVSNITDPKNRLSYVKYHMLLKGYYLNKLAPSITNKHPNIEKILDSSKDYAQFHELFEIMSEINSRKTLLDKFMSCYHALENYMLRTKIVAIISNNDGHLFGVRQFKHLGLQVEEKELDHLKKLFRTSSDRIVSGENQNLRDSIEKKFQSFRCGLGDPDQKNIRKFIEKTSSDGKVPNINFRNDTNDTDFYESLPKIIYQIRCSIVHNKATEYHLSSREMADPIKKKFIEELCIPCMEILAFGLPASTQGQDNRDKHPLKYTRESIPLY
ncbi:hypothetical protein GM608_02055 [Bombella sp. ESL0380]|uniref:hypothetical protein n=1 Tax=Bombella sp. ESL0380 TaxID=2676444 RepID=UPI00139CE4E2|nr:hypothetical protein [Bombella sp. ESL0380]